MIDINKKVQLCLLFDFYGKLLTQKQQEIFDLYYFQDMSLFEVSEELNISRQAVHDALAKTENSLFEFEKKCGIVEKYQNTKTELLALQQKLDTKDLLQAKISSEIHDIINKL